MGRYPHLIPTQRKAGILISFEDFKKKLGNTNLTDEEIVRLRDMEYQLADAIFGQWLKKRNEKISTVATGFIPPKRHNVSDLKVDPPKSDT